MTGRSQVQKRPGGGKNRGGGRGGHGSQYAGPKTKSKPGRLLDTTSRDAREDYSDEALDYDDFPCASNERAAGGRGAATPAKMAGSGNAAPVASRNPTAEQPPRPRRKVEMKRLHMNSITQKMVTEALQEIQGKLFSVDGVSVAAGRGDLHRSYWLHDRHLVVEGARLHAPGDAQQLHPEDEFRQYALDKLQSYGFHESRCLAALEATGGSVDDAVDWLLAEAFKPSVSSPSNIAEEEILAEREDELTALRAIFPETFHEKEQNRLWTVSLELEYLSREFGYRPRREPSPVRSKLPPCPYFARGRCRFGAKCRTGTHIAPRPVTPEHLRKPEEPTGFTLEVRLPPGSRYPHEPPMVALTAIWSKFPTQVCLQLTAMLAEHAGELAEHAQPVVFALASLLEDQELVLTAARGSYHPHSLPTQLATFATSRPSSADISNLQRNGTSSNKKLSAKSTPKQRRDISSLRQRFLEKTNNKAYVEFQEARAQFPAWKEREAIVDAVRTNQVVIVSGMTGCGKSTQVPQFLLDAWLSSDEQRDVSLVCTQPRRISAIGVAERVAQERTEKVGNTIGYQIRLESRTSAQTRLLFCTTGILLRRLEASATLSDVTHIIVDEVHERSEESDFLLMILRNLQPKRPDLRLLLMSATLDANLFSSYFGGAPVIDIPGKTYPVTQLFLEDAVELSGYSLEEDSVHARRTTDLLTREDERPGRDGVDWRLELDLSINQQPQPAASRRDETLPVSLVSRRYADYSERTRKTLALTDPEKINYDLIESLLTFLAEGEHEYPRTGAILVFLPGLAEIMTLVEQLEGHKVLGRRAGKFTLIPLHSSLSSDEQQLVFRKPKPGVRKIVISTNLAETSITIDDCVFVIDAGKMKEKMFDPQKRMESLETVWVSRANADQRKGRAGRVMPGVCFHLYSSYRYRHHIRGQPVPEIKRVPLEQLVLRIKLMPLFKGKQVHKVLDAVLEPPESESIVAAVKRLQDLGALDAERQLTPLGVHVAALPVDVRIGKLLLFGAVFRCLDAVTTIAACLSYRSPFVAPFSRRAEADARRRRFAAANSDQLTMLNGYQGWREAVERSTSAGYHFAQENFLQVKTLQTVASMKHQFVGLLADIGFVPAALTARHLEKLARGRADGVLHAADGQLNDNNGNSRLLSALLCAALYPNLVQVLTPETSYAKSEGGVIAKATTHDQLKFKTKDDGYVFIHPVSVNAKVSRFESPYLVYNEKVKTSRVFIRQCCMVPVYPLLLFAGNGIEVEQHWEEFIISLDDGWIKLTCPTQTIAALLKELRRELDRLLADKIADPSLDLLACPRSRRLIDCIVTLISREN